MRTTILSIMATIGSLIGLVRCRSIQVTERKLQYCGSADQPTIETFGDPEVGPGIWVTNNDRNSNAQYFLYENSRDQKPWKFLSIPQGTCAFVQVCDTFQGRIVRGNVAVNLDGQSHTLGTWVEFSVTDGTVWGDISFLEGSDGGAIIVATDGSGVSRGCEADLLTGAPADALRINNGGNAVVDTVVDKPWRAGNAAAKQWLLQQCGSTSDQVYLAEPNHSIISSANARFEVVFVDGVA
ncbi:hypothetical protein F5Y15DRAFT_428462 [Xylariaceae sp. FL0016]|nr:hypothetical protein F5Y15DRAFT_428462 [Xylariaceae sp. FL0016]